MSPTTATARYTVRHAVEPFLPSEPTFDLGTEPWIDVSTISDSSRRTVGLRELLLQAHTLQLDGARHGLLWTHAAVRFAVLLGYLLRHRDPEHDWAAVASGEQGLPADAIENLLDELGDRLWLLHPATPFLQHLPVLEQMDATPKKTLEATLEASTHSVWTLVPDVPAKSNTAWFGRSGERSSPTGADVANMLLVRHVYAMPGNEANNWGVVGGRVSDGDDAHATRKPSKRSEGGTVGLSHNGRTFAHLVGPNLAATLARNQLRRSLGSTTGVTFMTDPAPPANPAEADPLWLMFTTTAATILVPAPHAPERWRVVRTPMPWPKATAKAVSTEATRNDQFGLRVDGKTMQSRRNPGFSQVIISSAGSDLNVTRTFLKDTIESDNGLLDPTVLHSTSHAERVPNATANAFLTIIDGAGSATGPRIAGVSSYRPPVALDLPRERASWWLTQATTVAYRSGAASRLVGRAVHLTLNGVVGDVPDPMPQPPQWLYPVCHEQMLHRSEPVLLEMLGLAAGGEPLPLATTPEHVRTLSDAAFALFDELTGPAAHRPATAAARSRQRSILARRIRNHFHES